MIMMHPHIVIKHRLNYIDPVIVILLVWAFYRGFTRGLIVMVASFAALIAGVWGAVRFSEAVGDWLVNTMNVTSPYIHLVSFTITFIGIAIGINILAHLLTRFVDIIALGFINRLLGSVFGVLTMAFFLSVFFLILNAFNEIYAFLPEEQLSRSILYNRVANLAPGIFPFLRNIPAEIKNILDTV